MEKTSKQFSYKSIRKWISESTFLLLLLTVFLFFFLEAARKHNSVPFKLLWRNIINPIYMEKFIGFRFYFFAKYIQLWDLSLILRLFPKKIFFQVLSYIFHRFPRHLVIYNFEAQWQDTRFNILTMWSCCS